MIVRWALLVVALSVTSPVDSRVGNGRIVSALGFRDIVGFDVLSAPHGMSLVLPVC